MTIIILFIIYLGIQFAFNFFGKGNEWIYQINNGSVTFDVEEISSLRVDNNDDNYYFKVTTPNRVFTFQTYYNFNRSSHVIEKIEYYKDDNYECIYPIFKGDNKLVDIMCYYNNEFTYYQNIKGNANLDSFVNSLSNYDKNQFTDNAEVMQIDGVDIYKDNLIKDHYVGINNYTGLFDISANFNSVMYKINVYERDVYAQKLSVFSNEYYLAADYESSYEFNKFYLVDLMHLDTEEFTCNKKISVDSYIQGVVNNKVYLYDKDNKIQYEINLLKQTVVEVGRNGNIKNYVNGEWTTMTEADANNELKFNVQQLDYTNDSYERIDKIGNSNGYYYLYKKVNDGYLVYRKNIQDDTVFYLFKTKTIDHILYIDNYIYYIDTDTIKMYHDSFGVKKIATYSEFQFNKNLRFHVQVG